MDTRTKTLPLALAAAAIASVVAEPAVMVADVCTASGERVCAIPVGAPVDVREGEPEAAPDEAGPPMLRAAPRHYVLEAETGHYRFTVMPSVLILASPATRRRAQGRWG